MDTSVGNGNREWLAPGLGWAHDTARTVATLSALHELDHDIWVPFSRAYAAGDVDTYLGLHAPDFIWVRADEGIIEGHDDYCARIRRSFADLPAGITVHLAFRFTERIASSSLASERGIARMSGSGPRGPLPVRYNRFHTIARRTDDGRWRLVVDYDGGTTDAGTFDTAHEVDRAELRRPERPNSARSVRRQ